MRNYTELSNDVNRAVTNGDRELGEHLKKAIEPLAEEPRYSVLLNILEKVPDAETAQSMNSGSNRAPADEQLTKPKEERFMTLTEARDIVRAHKTYVKEHRKLVQSSLGVTNRHRKIRKLRRIYTSEIKKLNPTSIDAGNKLEMAKELLRMQTENSIDRDGSLVMSPRFQGGRLLSGGLPGSKK